MNWLVLAAPLWIVGATVAQQAPTGSKGLVRMYDNAHDGSAASDFDAESWRKKLLQPDLDAREQALDRLVEFGARTKGVRETIEAWAKDVTQPELAWTARMALRELDRSTALDSLFAPDRWSDLQSSFDELQRRFDAMGPLLDAPRAFPTPVPEAESTHKSFSLQIGPDGVACEVTERVNGEEKKQTYKADSLEDLLEAHPDLRAHIGSGSGGGAWALPVPGRRSDPWSGLHGRAFRRPLTIAPLPGAVEPGTPAGSPPTHYLGIECTPAASDKVQGMGLEPERGLAVERAVAGTIADILGIQRGDILITLNGTPLYSAQDVSNVLRRRAADAPIEVELIDKKGQRRTLTWRPTESPASPDERDG